MQTAFYFDQSRCINCFTCVVACKDWHDIPAGPASWRKVITIEQGSYPKLFVAFLSLSCCHCAEPACVPVCPASAINKRASDGIVVVDQAVCLGRDQCGGTCLDACPYDAPQFGAEMNPKMHKCDLCLERLTEGKPTICVAGCPTRALDAGPLADMKAKYGELRQAIGFEYDEKLKPSMVFKPKPEVASPIA